MAPGPRTISKKRRTGKLHGREEVGHTEIRVDAHAVGQGQRNDVAGDLRQLGQPLEEAVGAAHGHDQVGAVLPGFAVGLVAAVGDAALPAVQQGRVHVVAHGAQAASMRVSTTTS